MAVKPVHVDGRGRIVLPAAVRGRLSIEGGDRLAIRVEGGRIILEPRDKVVERLRRRFAKVPDDVSLTDELEGDRRREDRSRALEG